MLPSHLLKPWNHSAARSLEIRVKLHRTRDVLHFAFEVSGDLSEIQIPSLKPRSDRKRADELWRKTCFEVFLGVPHSQNYVEFNVSPNGDWNAYAFDSYRKGMRPVVDAIIDLESAVLNENGFSLRGRLQSRREGELSEIYAQHSVQASATAVVEFKNGETQYWAVKHAGEKPDFHLRSSFSIELNDSHRGET